MLKIKTNERYWGVLLSSFILPPLYFHLNLGGVGLALPYNVAAWLLSLFFILFVFITLLSHYSFRYNHIFVASLIFPVVIISSGFSSDTPDPINWIFRVLYLLGGFSFLFSLFQLHLTERRIERLLYALVISTFIQIFFCINQLYDINIFSSIVPYSNIKIPIGIFQQVNVLATYVVTGLIIILFLISRPSFISARYITKILFVITFGFGVFVIISTGSRVGILSLFISICLIFISRKLEFQRHRKIVLLLFGVSILAIIAGQSGLYRALNKTEQLTSGEYSSVRKTMYAIGVDLVDSKPFLGHGIGSFQRVWAEQTTLFVKQYPDAEISQGTVSHPHNEILLWMIEAGLISVFSLLMTFILICYSLYRCGFSRGGAYAALLLPITLHTQVELPFYISSIHWFLWLFLIFLVLRHQLISTRLSISYTARRFIQFSLLLVGIVLAITVINADRAQFEMAKYTNHRGGDLTVGLNDFYSHNYAEKLLMQTVLYSSIEKGNKETIPTVILWAEDRTQYKPEKGMFIILSDAYGFMNDYVNQCRTAQRGLAIYTKNIRLRNVQDEVCKNNEVNDD